MSPHNYKYSKESFPQSQEVQGSQSPDEEQFGFFQGNISENAIIIHELRRALYSTLCLVINLKRALNDKIKYLTCRAVYLSR